MIEPKILLLGKTGYMASAFIKTGVITTALSRSDFDYTDPSKLNFLLGEGQFTHLINCAGYTGKPNIDSCLKNKTETFDANIRLPIMLASACDDHNVVLCHLSSGCIYDNELYEYDENDTPNFSFRDGFCSIYSGTKELAEQAIRARAIRHYIWRIRMPFSQHPNPKNLITKYLNYKKLYEGGLQSLTNVEEFIDSSLECVYKCAPFGTYNMTQQGHANSHDIVSMMEEHFGPLNKEWFESDEEFYKTAKEPRSNCTLNSEKALNEFQGMKTPIFESLKNAISNYPKP